MILHDNTFEELANAPVKQTDVEVARQIQDPYGFYDDTLIWTSSDTLMSVTIDAVGGFLGTVTKKAVVKLLGIIDTTTSGDVFQVRLGLYDQDLLVLDFNYISQGFYIVDNIAYDYDAGSTTITMYDHMWRAQNSLYTNFADVYGFSFPATVEELAAQMASVIGVELMTNFSLLPNAEYNILVDPFATIANATVQTVIQEIAATTGTIARISDTTLVFKQYEVNGSIL